MTKGGNAPTAWDAIGFGLVGGFLAGFVAEGHEAYMIFFSEL